MGRRAHARHTREWTRFGPREAADSSSVFPLRSYIDGVAFTERCVMAILAFWYLIAEFAKGAIRLD
jgi:hypothetical protein